MAGIHYDQYRHRMFDPMQANTQRVRFHLSRLSIDSASGADVFRKAATEFMTTPQAQWVEDNAIKLQWAIDHSCISDSKQVVFYGDITEIQYTDYALRFL